MLVTNDKWNIFFIKYKYNNFIHVSRDEFLMTTLATTLATTMHTNSLFTRGIPSLDGTIRMSHLDFIGPIKLWKIIGAT
jgi:hypothetical protein